MTKKIWITRDREDEYADFLYFWRKKPKWNQTCYSCSCKNEEDDGCECEIANFDQDCGALERVLEVIGVPEGDIRRGQLVEISASVVVSDNKTLASNAKDLVKRMKSRGKMPTKKEIMKLLTEMSQDADDDDERTSI